MTVAFDKNSDKNPEQQSIFGKRNKCSKCWLISEVHGHFIGGVEIVLGGAQIRSKTMLRNGSPNPLELYYLEHKVTLYLYAMLGAGAS